MGKEDLLSDLKDVQFFMDQITTDHLDGVHQSFFNRAKNKLMQIIAEGEAKVLQKLRSEYENDCPFPSQCSKRGCQGLCKYHTEGINEIGEVP